MKVANTNGDAGHDDRKTKTQERIERQRDRILEAAKRCFIEHGFHAASMANISESAQMSPGLIYRYFENKNSIILAIIERQLQESKSALDALNHGMDLFGLFAGFFARLQSRDDGLMNPTLFLEMSAEGTRDPQIARALSDSDKATRAGISSFLERTARAEGRKLEATQIHGCALILQCLIEGLFVRAVREPGLDPAFMGQSLHLVVPYLQKGAPAGSGG